MKYDVKISCLGHTFNIKGVEAASMENANAKAEAALMKSIYVVSTIPTKRKTGENAVEDLMAFFGIKKK